MQEKKFIKNSKKNQVIEFFVPQESRQFHKIPVEYFQWQQYLSASQFSILLYITSKVHKSKGYAYPSIKTAIKDCNVSENTFLKSVDILEKLKLIFVDRENRSNRYYLLIPDEPNLELIHLHLPKQKKKIAQNENQPSKYKFIKHNLSNQEIHSAEENDIEVVEGKALKFECKKTDFEVKTPQNLKINSNSENLNLSQSNSNLVDLRNSKTFSEENNKDIKLLLDIGFEKHNVHSTLELIDSETDLKDFIHYVFNIYCKDQYIKNRPGFLLHAIKNGQIRDYKIYKNKQIEKFNKAKVMDELETQLDELKEKLFEHSEKTWDSLNDAERQKIKNQCIDEGLIVNHFTLSDDLEKALYIEMVRDHYLSIDPLILEIIDQKNLIRAGEYHKEILELREKYLL